MVLDVAECRNIGANQQWKNLKDQPWWARILEKQGISTVFALLLLAGGWRLGDAHLDFLEHQHGQMMIQTRTLAVIAESNVNQEKALSVLTTTLVNARNETMHEHQRILDKQYK